MRIAHVSDLHVRTAAGLRVLDLVSTRIVGALNLVLRRAPEFPESVVQALLRDLRDQAVDHLVVSGDLSNLSLRGEMELGRSLLEELGLPAERISVVPGNHDCYTYRTRAADPFGDVFAPHMSGDFEVDGQPFPFVRLRGPLALIGLSTARPSPPMMAVGTLGQQQIERTVRLLGDPRLAGRFRLVVLHHPPRSPHVKWHARLTDGDALIRALEPVGAELVLHGHLHRTCGDLLPGPAGGVPVIGLTSSTWLSEDPARRARYNIYELETVASSDALRPRWLATQTRGYDDQAGEFVAFETPPPHRPPPAGRPA